MIRKIFLCQNLLTAKFEEVVVSGANYRYFSTCASSTTISRLFTYAYTQTCHKGPVEALNTPQTKPCTMAASCCASTSTRFVASSSYRARNKRTLAIHHHPLAFNATSKIGNQSPMWAGYGGSASRLRLRGVAVDLFPTQTRAVYGGLPELLPRAAASSRCWLEYLRRHAQTFQDTPAHSRKKISTMVACALCFVASASSATTASQSSAGPNPASNKFSPGGGGLGPRKTTQPGFVFSKQKAEEEVRKVEDDARQNPYLVSLDPWSTYRLITSQESNIFSCMGCSSS